MEVTRELVVLRLQGERADVHFEERVASLAVIGWWVRVERRRKKKENEDAAAAARTRRHTFRGQGVRAAGYLAATSPFTPTFYFFNSVPSSSTF